ncbi:MAG: hypothetical protein KJ831_20580, partial [Candidatus Eisenbacteria bacterium]|nr:hypothetical protein [Candidatus Eisenbacteria bacterium]
MDDSLIGTMEQVRGFLEGAEAMKMAIDSKSESYDWVRWTLVRFALVQYKRKKYRCRCNANIVTAPAPVKLRPGNRYSLDFAVEVASEKYLEHNPLDRQCRKMQR